VRLRAQRADWTSPIAERWYLHRDKGESVRVVAIDSATGYVETQSFDGDVEKLEADDWREFNIEAAEALENWTGPYDESDSVEAKLLREWRTLRSFGEDNEC
jgi:hypothetical protein